KQILFSLSSFFFLLVFFLHILPIGIANKVNAACQGSVKCCDQAIAYDCPCDRDINGVCKCDIVETCPGNVLTGGCGYYYNFCTHSYGTCNEMSGSTGCYEVQDCPNQGEYYCTACGGCVNTGGLGCNEYAAANPSI